MFAQLYVCPIHGKVWQVSKVEAIDTERDEVEEYFLCGQCQSSVRPFLTDGRPTYHVLSEEEMYWDMYDGGEDE